MEIYDSDGSILQGRVMCSDGTIAWPPIDDQLEKIFDIIGERFNIKYRDVMDMDEKQKKQLIRNLKIDSI